MAALQGKQVLLAKIEQENLDAHQSLENELQQLRQAKRSAKAAQQVICELLSQTNTFHLISIDSITRLENYAYSSFQSAVQAMNHLNVLQSALK